LAGKKVVAVELLGLNSPLKWEQGLQGLRIQVPATRTGKHAYSFKVVCEDL
jgi:hypothetical protein